MKKSFNQKEFIDLLNANPYQIKAHYNELDELEDGDYIFVDRISDSSILSDDTAVYKNNVLISVYCKNADDLVNVVKYLRNHFIYAPTYTSEDEYNVASGSVSIFVSDW